MANPTNYASATELELQIKLAFYVLTLLVGLTGNSLVLVILARKARRVVNDLFIINLAIADLSLLLFSIPITVLFYGKFHYTDFVCKLIWPMMTIANTVSILTLVLMAMCRCHVILNSFRPDIRQGSVLRGIGLTWLLAIALLLPLMIVAQENPEGEGCEEDWSKVGYRKGYTATLFVLQYILPLTAIAIAYIRIGIDLWKPQREMEPSWAEQDKKGREKRRQENMQIIKTLATIVLLFAICMLPGHVAWIMSDFGSGSGARVASVILRFFDILVYIHSCMNPIVYGTLTKFFRREYTRYFNYFFCCNTDLENFQSTRHQSHFQTQTVQGAPV